jgi:uncharacterized delta-60 repeat protein
MKKFILFLSTILLFTNTSNAQNPGDIAQSFGSFPGFNNSTEAIAIQNDEKIIVGGGFTTYNGSIENYICRLNSNGTKDNSFNSGLGFDQYISEIVIQSDGKILVGGAFTSYNGITENYMIRLNTDGSKDTSFNIGSGFNGTVLKIVLQTDGKILVGGDFTTFNGTIENRIVRLNADGSKDIGFNSGTGFNSGIKAITLQPDGKILVGGYFTTYNDSIENHLIRLNTDGTKDISFNTGTGFNDENYYINTINVQSDGKILLGGFFYEYNGNYIHNIIRLNSNATFDTSFDTGIGFNEPTDIIYTIFTRPDGKILVGGNFSSYNGINGHNFIVSLNEDGTINNGFVTGTGFDGDVYEILQQNDGKLLLCGFFTSYNGAYGQNYIVRLNDNGIKDTSFTVGTGFNNSVWSFAKQVDGKMIVGGQFTSYNGNLENCIIRLNTDGSKDTSFNTGTGFDNTTVNTIVVQPDGKILVGGGFGSYNGIAQFYIIRLNIDGSVDSSFNTGAGFNSGGVNKILLQTDGKILVGGDFTNYNGITENRIIRLNSNGSKDSSFNAGSGFNANVLEIKKQLDGKILVGGVFTSYNGTTENYLIRLNTDGSKDTSFNTGTGFDEPIYTIELQNDGKILVGGAFTSYNGTNKNSIIRLNTNGTIDTSFNIQSGLNYILVLNIKTQTDEKIMISGNYSSLNGSSLYGIMRFYSDGSIDTTFNNGFDSAIVGVSEVENGTFYAWGGYYTYNNNSNSSFFVKLYYDANLSHENITNPEIILLYPNPAKEIINVGLLNQVLISNVKIYDLQGKVVLQDTNDTINVSNLAKGIYIVKIVTVEGEVTKKFIKE